MRTAVKKIKNAVNFLLVNLFGVKLVRLRKNSVKRKFKHIPHTTVQPQASYSPWVDDDNFQKIYEVAKQYTLVDIYRCYELYSLVRQLKDVEGAILEVGVWRGGSAAVIQGALRDSRVQKNFYIADTFEGVVKTSERDTNYSGGEHADTDEKIVEEVFDRTGLRLPIVLKGVFPDDHPNAITENIALLHSDVDAYASSKDIVEWALPKLSPNAIVVFDDYGFYGCEGVTDFCNELRANTDLTFVHNLNGHAIFIKRARVE